jgi:hypothetical protein
MTGPNTSHNPAPEKHRVTDTPQYEGTPWWGWLLIVIALSMFAGLIVKALSTGRAA